MQPSKILYLTENEVKQTLTVPEALELAEKGIKADATDRVAGNKFYMSVEERGFIKPFSGHFSGEDFSYVKTFSYFPANSEQFGLPTTSSMVLLFDSQTGLPVCIMEAGWVTGLKTAASSVVTTSFLARKDASIATVFGAGSLGRMHLRALSKRFSIQQAYVIDILPDVARDYAENMTRELGISVKAIPLNERQQAVEESHIIFTVTTGDQPLIKYTWIKPGTFIARLGSFQEVALDVITRADKVVVDKWKYVSPRIPELIELTRNNTFTEDDLHAEWPDIVAGRISGRESSDEIIIFIALGIWGEYAAILPEVYRKALKKGLGQWLPSSFQKRIKK